MGILTINIQITAIYLQYNNTFQDRQLIVTIKTSFQTFTKWLKDDERFIALDIGNVKLTFNTVSSPSCNTCECCNISIYYSNNIYIY